MNLKPLYLLFLSLLFSAVLFAQSPVSVNPLTGAADAVIPIANYQRGSIKFPVNLVYNGTGVKPTDVEGTAGMSWQLEAANFAVVREVRGIPDDCQKDALDSLRTGWIYTTNQATINGFTPANTGTPNCTNEASDISFINSHFSYKSDTEPDIFYVNAPGLHCQLVFDQTSGHFHAIGYQDLKISFGKATDHEINSFSITNDAGTTYNFNAAERTYQYIIGSGTPAYFANTYNQYINGIYYYDKWYLTGISDINGNGISLAYTTAPARGSKDSIKVAQAGFTNIALEYIIGQSVTPQQLSTIELTADNDGNFTNQTLTFTWADPLADGSGMTCISGISGRGRNITFDYMSVKYTEHTGGGTYYRAFLSNIYETICNTPLFYKFSYAGLTDSAGYYSTTMPDSLSTKNDYWGYYTTFPTSGTLLPAVYASPTTSGYPAYLIEASSGNTNYNYTLSGANRAVDTSVVYYGALTQITNVNNGTVTIGWQSNDYYDLSAGATVLGGGIRVKQLTWYDAISTAHNIVHTYTYTNPSTGYSSGKPISVPQFAFTVPYSGTATGLQLWEDATTISAYDLSTEDHTIVYEYERETATGAGSTLTQFYVPATNWDASATPDCSGCTTPDWYPTTDLVARNPCTSYSLLASTTASYPFIPNPNYDFERGLPKKVTTYTDSNVESSEVDYTYQRTANPTQIPAFKYETNFLGTVLGYNKYIVNYNTAELVSQQMRTVFDASTHTQANIDTVNYAYGPVYHKLKTTQVRNSDGNIVTQTYYYVKDYTAASDTNGYITALYNLQQLNVDGPVETYTTIQNHSGTYYTQAALTLYRPFPVYGTNVYRPFRQLSWVQPSGLTTFSKFTVNSTAQTISYDSNYFISADFMDYDQSGVLQSSDDGNKHEGSRFYDHVTNNPIAVFTNARAGEVWFQDFDSEIYFTSTRSTLTGITLLPTATVNRRRCCQPPAASPLRLPKIPMPSTIFFRPG